MRQLWTAKETATALQLYSSGHTFTDIAQTLRRTRGEVAGKLFRLRRDGAVIGRLAKERPPPREPKNPKPKQASPKAQCPSKPRLQPVIRRRIKVTPDHRPHPPQYIMPPKPVGPPTCWELGHNDCRFPIGRRDGNGPTTFCAKRSSPARAGAPSITL